MEREQGSIIPPKSELKRGLAGWSVILLLYVFYWGVLLFFQNSLYESSKEDYRKGVEIAIRQDLGKRFSDAAQYPDVMSAIASKAAACIAEVKYRDITPRDVVIRWATFGLAKKEQFKAMISDPERIACVNKSVER